MWRLEVWNQGVVRTMLSFQAARKNSSLLLCSFWGLSAILGLLWLVDISLKSLPPHHHMHFCCVSQFSSVTQSCPTLWPHGLQHTRLPRPSPTPKACSNSCPTSQWCHATTSSSVIPFSSCPPSFPASRSLPNELALRIRWPKHWNFSFIISPSCEYLDLISFRSDWLDLLTIQGWPHTPWVTQ